MGSLGPSGQQDVFRLVIVEPCDVNAHSGEGTVSLIEKWGENHEKEFVGGPRTRFQKRGEA